jgi:hypothetical protein
MGKPNPLCKPVASPYLIYTTSTTTTTTTSQPYNDDEDFSAIIIPTNQISCNPSATTTTQSPSVTTTTISPLSYFSFDPNYLGNNIVLSNNNLTARFISSSTDSPESSVLTNLAILSGQKIVFSMIIDVNSGRDDYTGVGIANHSFAPQAQYLGEDNNSFGFYDDAVLYQNNTSINSIGSTFLLDGSIVDVAVDRVNNLIWYRVNNGAWNNNGDPVNSLGGYDISGITGNIYPAAVPYYYLKVGQISINTSQPTSLPTGFTYINPITTTTTATLPPLPAPLSYYLFENNANDANGLNNPSTLSNLTFVTGKIGSFAADFNGSTSITLPKMIQNDFTISFWVKTTQTSAVAGFGGQFYQGQSFLNGEVGGMTTDFGLSYLNNKIAFGVGGPDTTIFSSSTINTGNWTHVTCTRNNSTGLMQIYINGIFENSTTGPTGSRTATSSLTIGPNFVGGTGFIGQMDQLRIYNVVL